MQAGQAMAMASAVGRQQGSGAHGGSVWSQAWDETDEYLACLV